MPSRIGGMMPGAVIYSQRKDLANISKKIFAMSFNVRKGGI